MNPQRAAILASTRPLDARFELFLQVFVRRPAPQPVRHIRRRN